MTLCHSSWPYLGVVVDIDTACECDAMLYITVQMTVNSIRIGDAFLSWLSISMLSIRFRSDDIQHIFPTVTVNNIYGNKEISLSSRARKEIPKRRIARERERFPLHHSYRKQIGCFDLI
jgi:hypothetical protein